jgi:CHRD domain
MAYHVTSGRTETAQARCRKAYGQTVLSLLALVLCAWSLAVLGCGGDDDDTEQRSANLTGAQEVPPVTVTSANGTATLTFNEARTQIDFILEILTALPNIREAHLHIGPAGVNGPIVLDFCTNPALINPPAGVPLPPTCPPAPFRLTGSLTAANLRPITPAIQAAGVNSFADAVSNILSGNAYVNVHTSAFTGGEIRGQVSAQ